jgi:hypothetical protein
VESQLKISIASDSLCEKLKCGAGLEIMENKGRLYIVIKKQKYVSFE